MEFEMKSLKIISLTIGALAGLGGILGSAFSLHQLSSAYKDERTKRWQSVVIYSHIEKAGESGIAFDNLRSKYLDSVLQFSEFELPKEQISDETLRWVMLDLISRGAITTLPSFKYKVLFEPAYVRDPMVSLAPAMYQAQELAYHYLDTEPNKYDRVQLGKKLLEEIPDLSHIQIDMMLQQATLIGIFQANDEGKLSLGTAPVSLGYLGPAR